MGVLARPHREEQENKNQRKKHTRMAARDARNALVQLWRVSPSAQSFAWTSRSARFSGPVPPPRTHPMGAALVASASGIAELAVPASRGRGAEVAFSRRRRVGEPTWRSSLAMASSSVGGTGGSAGCSPCAPSDSGGGGGETFASRVEGSPPSLSSTRFSPPASPVGPVSSGASGVEFGGVTSKAD